MSVKNEITIRSVYKVTRGYFEPAINPETRNYAPCVRRVNSQGDQILRNEDLASGAITIGENEFIEIYDGKVFDLDNEIDAAWWEAIKYSPRIAQDRFAKNHLGELVIDGNAKKYGTAEFYVERPGFEAKTKNNRKREVHEAKAHIYADTTEGMLQKVKLLGSPMIGRPIDEVEQYLIDQAEKDPLKIKDLYTGPDTRLKLILIDALDKNTVTYKDGVYMFGDRIVLGVTETAVLAWFKNPDNKRLFAMLKAEVYPDIFDMPVEEEPKEEPKKTTSKKV